MLYDNATIVNIYFDKFHITKHVWDHLDALFSYVLIVAKSFSNVKTYGTYTLWSDPSPQDNAELFESEI